MSCPISNMAFVAIKMGRRSGSCRTRGGRISDRCVTDPAAAGQPAGSFSSQPSGPWPVGCFSSAAADHSLRINSDMLVASASAARTALKNSRLIRQLPDESHVIYGTGHLEIFTLTPSAKPRHGRIVVTADWFAAASTHFRLR